MYRPKRKNPWLTAVFLVTSGLILLGSSAATSEIFYGGHLSVVEGSVSIQSPTDEALSPAEMNLLVEEGTRLLSASDSRAEIRLSGNDVLRIWDDTEVDFVGLEGSVEVWMRAGSVYVRTSPDRSEDCGMKVVTPTSTVCVTGGTILRVDVEDERRTRVSVLEGHAEVFFERESVGLGSAQTATVAVSGIYGPIRFRMDHRDRFIEWCSERDEVLGSPGGHPHLPVDVPAARELDDHGSWVYAPEVKLHVWRPRVVVGWSPYHHGRWTWSIRYGWFWVSYEPWGWVPYHYGSWSWYARCGWVWVPGAVWHGARVNWVVCGDYIGWRPLLYGHNHITVKVPARHHRYHYVHKTSIRSTHRRIVKLEKGYVKRHKIVSVRTPTSIVGAKKVVRRQPERPAVKRTYGQRLQKRAVQGERNPKDRISYRSGRGDPPKTRSSAAAVSGRRGDQGKKLHSASVSPQQGSKRYQGSVSPKRVTKKYQGSVVPKQGRKKYQGSVSSKQGGKRYLDRGPSGSPPRAVKRPSGQHRKSDIRGQTNEGKRRISKPRASYRSPPRSGQVPSKSFRSGRTKSMAPSRGSASRGRVHAGPRSRR